MKFLKEYGSIENLLANTSQLKGKIKEKIENSAERGILSKKLATIICDVPIEFHQEQYDLETPDFEKVREVFDEIEFRRLYENLYRAFQKSDTIESLSATKDNDVRLSVVEATTNPTRFIRQFRRIRTSDFHQKNGER
jgi:DNA polymerase-1